MQPSVLARFTATLKSLADYPQAIWWPTGRHPEALVPQVRRAQISAAVWQAGLPPRSGKGAYLRFSKSTGFSTVAEDRCEGALLAFQPLSRYAPIPEPEPNSLPTASRPPSSPLQAYYWPTSSQLVGNHSDVDPIHIGVVA